MMIIDFTETKIEQDMHIAHLQEQLQQTHNNPNIRFGCSCGKDICYGHAPKISGTDADQYICRHHPLDGIIKYNDN